MKSLNEELLRIKNLINVISESFAIPQIDVVGDNIRFDGSIYEASSKGFDIPVKSIDKSKIDSEKKIYITVEEPHIPLVNKGGIKTHPMDISKIMDLKKQKDSGKIDLTLKTSTNKMISLKKIK